MAQDDDEEDCTPLLPPLPVPDHQTRDRQHAVGCATVCSLIVFFVSSASALCLPRSSPVPRALGAALVGALIAEACVALACLAGLRWVDPGVITRDATRQPPLPEEVSRALRSGDTLPSRNVEDAARGDFCVRCLVWRAPPPPPPLVVTCRSAPRGGRARWPTALLLLAPCRNDGDGDGARNGGGACDGGARRAAHHCALCQRCVADFSHHCGFFGRCIAGRGLRRGNVRFLRVIIADGYAAAATWCLVVIAYAALRDDAAPWRARWLPALAAAYVVYFLARGGAQLIATLVRFAVIRRCPRVACEADPPPLPPEPTVVVMLGPWCGRYVPIKC